MKKLINNPNDIVDGVIEGLLDVHKKKYVCKLEAARTVVRADAPTAGKVGVITGGKSVLFLLFNYTWDIMSFQMAADISVQKVISIDDVGSGPRKKSVSAGRWEALFWLKL
jgi:dihydroxyacetone kinase